MSSRRIQTTVTTTGVPELNLMMKRTPFPFLELKLVKLVLLQLEIFRHAWVSDILPQLGQPLTPRSNSKLFRCQQPIQLLHELAHRPRNPCRFSKLSLRLPVSLLRPIKALRTNISKLAYRCLQLHQVHHRLPSCNQPSRPCRLRSYGILLGQSVLPP